ncbi:hypothetical protein [Rhodococcus sp. X156]|uniref:hypothetical protein n=1 Tax=Rhodococcus sp. X156 TaxID=2499145 RepID=UPI000FD94E6E|nr:hypothetical protein [Rhodococcus sp. X156]
MSDAETADTTGVLTAEGSDVRRLVEQLRERHGDISVLSHERVRRGGVAGFFARESFRLTYRVQAAPPAPAEVDPAAALEPAELDPVAALVADADRLDHVDTSSDGRTLSASEDGWHVDDALLDLLGSTDHRESTLNGTPHELDFAQVLQNLVGGTSSPNDTGSFNDHGSVNGTGHTSDGPDDVPDAGLLDLPRSPAAPSVGGGAATRRRMEMLVQLRDLGVPVLTGPAAGTDNVFQALADILDELPPPPLPPRGAGELLVLVGDLAPSLRTAHAVAATLRLDPAGIRVAGHPGDPVLAHPGTPVMSTPAEATALRAELTTATTPAVLVLGTDGGPEHGEDPWGPAMLQALHPTVVWAVVDATSKTEDTRARLRPLGVDALCVHSSRRSTSPATVWDLDLPVALLDGRPADATAWAGLLFALLRTGARRAST